MTETLQTSGRGEASRLLAPIAMLASEAGRRIVEIAAEGAAARTKADNSPVTEADEAAETILTHGLLRLLPGVPVIAEEAAAHAEPPRPQGTYLLVDPIDGTRELIAGRDEFTVNVALVENHTPVLGVVYAPKRNALYAGADGRAWRVMIAPGERVDPEHATAVRVRPRPQKLAALVSRSHPDPISEDFLSRLPVTEKIPLGSSLKFAILAEGGADVYARLASVNEWDIGAGHALLVAAGGRVTAPDGSALAYGKREHGFRVDGFVAWGGERPQ